MTWVRKAFGTTVSGLPTTFWWLWAGTLVNRAGAFVLPFLAFYLTDELDLTPSFVGLVLGGFGLGSVVASLVGGVLSDRLGRRPVLLGSQLGTAATLVALGFTTSQAGVVLLVALLGLASNTARPAFSAMITDIVAPADRVRAFSLNYWAINLGFAIAPVLGGLLARAGYLTLFLVDAATTLVFAVLVFLKVPESRPEVAVVEGARPGSLADVFRDRVFMVVVGLTFLFALVFMQHLSSLPVQMGDDGLSASQYGTVIALNGAAHRLRHGAAHPLAAGVRQREGARGEQHVRGSGLRRHSVGVHRAGVRRDGRDLDGGRGHRCRHRTDRGGRPVAGRDARPLPRGVRLLVRGRRDGGAAARRVGLPAPGRHGALGRVRRRLPGERRRAPGRGPDPEPRYAEMPPPRGTSRPSRPDAVPVPMPADEAEAEEAVRSV